MKAANNIQALVELASNAQLKKTFRENNQFAINSSDGTKKNRVLIMTPNAVTKNKVMILTPNMRKAS